MKIAFTFVLSLALGHVAHAATSADFDHSGRDALMSASKVVSELIRPVVLEE